MRTEVGADFGAEFGILSSAVAPHHWSGARQKLIASRAAWRLLAKCRAASFVAGVLGGHFVSPVCDAMTG